MTHPRHISVTVQEGMFEIRVARVRQMPEQSGHICNLRPERFAARALILDRPYINLYWQ